MTWVCRRGHRGTMSALSVIAALDPVSVDAGLMPPNESPSLYWYCHLIPLRIPQREST